MEYNELSYKLGYILDDVPEDVLNLVREHCDRAQKLDAPCTDRLVGQIHGSWEVPFDDELTPLVDYLSTLASEYEAKTGKREAPEGMRKLFRHQDFWFNHQKKTEFQPAHDHAGDYSFVIWLKVPYSIEDEHNLQFSGHAAQLSTACFGFIAPLPFEQRLSQVYLPVDRTYEGKAVLFPSGLTHIVYPFYTSDDVRVSFAGNLVAPLLIKDT